MHFSDTTWQEGCNSRLPAERIWLSGQWPLTMRARCPAYRYFPISKGILAPGKDCNWKIRCALQHPLGIVTAFSTVHLCQAPAERQGIMHL